MANIGPKNYLFYTLVLVLVVANVRLLLVQKWNNTPITEYDLPLLGETINPFSIALHDNSSAEYPFTNKDVSLLYFSGTDAYSIGEINYLYTLSQTSIGSKMGMAIFFPMTIPPRNIAQYVRLPLLLINNDVQYLFDCLGKDNMRLRSIIVVDDGVVVYEGGIRKDYLSRQVFRIATESYNTEPTTINLNDKIQGTIFTSDTLVILADNMGTCILLLYPTYCGDCGDSQYYYRILNVTGVTTYLILPQLQDNQQVLQYILKSNPRIPFYMLDMNNTNIPIDQFFRGAPSAIVLKDDTIIYTTTFSSTEDDIINAIRQPLPNQPEQ